MKSLSILLLSLFILFVLSGCGGKPAHHPKNPRYEIYKPTIKYKPSKKNLAKMVKQLQGSPYVWAEEGPSQFDCSGFTYYMYGSMGLDIPRTAREQARVGKRVPPNQLQYGDLIFFATNKYNQHRITHVGMYLGDGWFTHASTVKHEVIYSNLFQSQYYKNKLRICRRYLPSDNTILNSAQNIWETALKKNNDTIQKHKAVLIHSKQLDTVSTKGQYYIQVGSFRSKPDTAFSTKIKSYGLPIKTIHYMHNENSVYQVLIGPYKNKEAALSQLPDIRKNIGANAFIAEIR